MNCFRAIALCAAFASCAPAYAGYDMYGVVSRIQVKADGNLWFAITPNAGMAPLSTFCAPQWAGLDLYIPSSNPQYAYYYGLLMTSLTKNKTVLIANIDVFNGVGPCDVTRTGYGLVLWQ